MANTDVFSQAVDASFQNAYATASINQGALSNLYATVPSSGASNTYSMLTLPPTVYEKFGDRQFSQLTPKTKTVLNRDWRVDVLTAPLTTINDDNAGLYLARAAQAGIEAANWKAYQILDALKNYATTTDWFGDALIADTHASGHNFDNKTSKNCAASGGESNVAYLISHAGAERPLMWQNRQEPVLGRNDDADMNETGTLRFFGDFRGAAFGGNSSLVVGCLITDLPTVAECQDILRDMLSFFTNMQFSKTSVNDSTRYIHPALQPSQQNMTLAVSVNGGINHIFAEALSANLIGGGNSNVLQNMCNLVASPYLNP